MKKKDIKKLFVNVVLMKHVLMMKKQKELFKDFLDYYFVTNQKNYLNKDNRLLN